MNVNNDNAELACTDLKLSLGYSDHCISSRLSSHGTGVNAISARLGMTFGGSDPIAELVWSPLNGLSLKCADYRFIRKSTPTTQDLDFVIGGNLVKSQASVLRNFGGKSGIGPMAGKSREMEEVNSKNKTASANDKESQNKKTMDVLSPETNEPLLRDNKELMPIPISSSSSPKGRNKDSISNTENKNEVKLECFASVVPPERLECTAENEMPVEIDSRHVREDRLLKGKSVQIETSPAFSKALFNKDKGKGKVLSEGGDCKKISKEEDDSAQSVESCNSVGFAGRKRDRFERLMISSSKRVKDQIHENPSLTSRDGQRSSFMNWISNMVKVSNRINENTEPSLALALTTPKECHVGDDRKTIPCKGEHSRYRVGDMGFSTYFQSIYCPEQKEMVTKTTIESTPMGESKELVLAGRLAGPSATPISCHGYLPCADVGTDGGNSSSSGTHGKEKLRNDVDNKFDNPGSLWVTRFSRKSHEHLVNLEGASFTSNKGQDKTNETSTFVSNDLKNKALTPSMFAKRIDALKDIAPPDFELTTCFYCGKVGHDLRNCSEIADTDRDFIGNISSYDGIGEAHSCLCIRCFQLDHWAISCPKAQMFTEKIPSQFNIGTSRALTLGHGAEKEVKSLELPKGTYDVIRKLRLSRADAIKLMNSHSSLSTFSGFFLRLRIGKWERSSGGTGYYAARISGEQREKQPQGSKGPIAVDIGGNNCLISSQHISNQDFVEDEITEWLLTTVRRGGTIPSEEDLKMKLEAKVKLGF